MDPKAAIERLLDAGWNQTAIAESAETTQPTISRILAGRPTGFVIGQRLVQLAQKADQPKRRKAA